MNLHGIVAGAIGAVNPMRPMTIKQSTGFAIVDYAQVPTYETIQACGQVQALTGKDLAMLNGLNVQGATNAIYLAGNYKISKEPLPRLLFQKILKSWQTAFWFLRGLG